MWKKGIAELLVESVMSLYEGVMSCARVYFELLEEFNAKFGMHQVSVPSHFLFTVVVHVDPEIAC